MIRCALAVTFALALQSTLCPAQSAALLNADTASGEAPEAVNQRLRSADASLRPVIQEAEAMGWELFRYETVTDIARFVVARDLPKEFRAELDDAIVSRENGWRVRFYKTAATGEHEAMADVVFSSSAAPALEFGASLAPLSPRDLALIRARDLVEAQHPAPCPDERYLHVALPVQDGGILVYQLRVPVFASELPVGLHKRYILPADGSRVLAEASYGRYCNSSAPRQGDAGTNYAVSDSEAAAPTEIHVYLSLHYRQAILLGTLRNNLYWSLRDGVIRPDV